MLIDKTPDPIKEKSKTEIQVKKDQKQEFKLIGSMIIKPGLTLYELDTQKMEIREAEIQRENMVNFETKKPKDKAKTMFNPDYIYYQCHNLKAAVKKANKIVKAITGIENYFRLEGKKVLRKVVK